MQAIGLLAMVLALVGAALAVTQLSDVAVLVLPETAGLLNTVIAALPYMGIVSIAVILVVWVTK